jgi:hypothetical protein
MAIPGEGERVNSPFLGLFILSGPSVDEMKMSTQTGEGQIFFTQSCNLNTNLAIIQYPAVYYMILFTGHSGKDPKK